MKYILSSILAASICIFSSCLTGGTDANTGQVASSGTWKVSLYTDSGSDKTTDFAGYTFTFSDGGTLTVVKSGVTKTGTWSVNNSSHKFTINLGAKDNSNKPLGELTDDWKIVSTTDTVITLKDDNTPNNEQLTFSKN